MLYLGEVLNVLNALLQIGDPIDEYGQLGVEWYFPVDVGLAMHEAAEGTLVELVDSVFLLLLLQSISLRLFLAHYELLLTILEVENQLSDDAVLPLAVRSTIEEDRSVQMCFLVLP